VAESHSTVLRTASSTHWQHSPDDCPHERILFTCMYREAVEIETNLERVPVRERSVKQQHHPIRAVGILLGPGVAGAGGVGVQSALGDHFRDIRR
jgi:hypothetical protein